MEFFLHYFPLTASVNYGSIPTQGKGMQVYRYPNVLHYMYCAGLRSYGFYWLTSLVYHTMEGYLKLEFYARAVGSQNWFTVNCTPDVLLVVTSLSWKSVRAVLWSGIIMLTELWDLRLSPTMISGWENSLVIRVNLLGWSDTHILMKLLTYEDYEKMLMSKRVAHYVEKHYNTRSQSFKDDYFIMLLRQCPYCTFFFAKGLKKMETPSSVSVMLLVGKLIILLRVYSTIEGATAVPKVVKGGRKGGERKEDVTKLVKAGLTFPVGRMARYLKKGRYAERVGFGAIVYLAAVLEYLAAEVLELAENVAGVTIASGGVLTNNNAVWFPKKDDKAEK
ncbi:hypothetical protein MKX03_014241 [Papaver bracteatum]|nr:hypothetical protein MKX03_014241 [Papaver bracteatum]